VTPPNQPYVQDWDEWVLVLEGSARLQVDGVGERLLVAGEHLLIPPGVQHFVTYTADPTVWLAVHIGE
jgi:cupin 2 domain-containing protein